MSILEDESKLICDLAEKIYDLSGNPLQYSAISKFAGELRSAIARHQKEMRRIEYNDE